MAAARAAGFRRFAVLGTGLVGGSFGLAVRKYLPDAHVIGWDKPDVLEEARAAGAIHEGFADFSRVLADADLVYFALPVGLTIDLLPQIARRAEPHALVTDACSTKAKICRAASEHFPAAAGDSPLFLGGHPMAGRELPGIGAADAELFRGAKYALIGEAGDADEGRVASFVALLECLGAQPMWLDAETHDWAVAIVSHLPQLASIALAGVVREETDETGLPVTLAGPGLRELLRLSGSPYGVWRDIVLTNTENISRALDRLVQAIEHLRMRLASRELEDEFAAANDLYKILRDLQ
jgi:prephenate dehydrogenase